jgi:hypothetical protein
VRCCGTRPDCCVLLCLVCMSCLCACRAHGSAARATHTHPYRQHAAGPVKADTSTGAAADSSQPAATAACSRCTPGQHCTLTQQQQQWSCWVTSKGANRQQQQPPAAAQLTGVVIRCGICTSMVLNSTSCLGFRLCGLCAKQNSMPTGVPPPPTCVAASVLLLGTERQARAHHCGAPDSSRATNYIVHSSRQTK